MGADRSEDAAFAGWSAVLCGSAWSLATVVGRLTEISDSRGVTLDGSFAASSLSLVLGILLIVIGLGLVRRRRWAWLPATVYVLGMLVGLSFVAASALPFAPGPAAGDFTLLLGSLCGAVLMALYLRLLLRQSMRRQLR